MEKMDKTPRVSGKGGLRCSKSDLWFAKANPRKISACTLRTTLHCHEGHHREKARHYRKGLGSHLPHFCDQYLAITRFTKLNILSQSRSVANSNLNPIQSTQKSSNGPLGFVRNFIHTNYICTLTNLEVSNSMDPSKYKFKEGLHDPTSVKVKRN